MSLDEFYNEWYEHGYMDDWPAEKKDRVFHIIKELDMPSTGNALDFGCGNGVFTQIIKKALPEWKVYGTDISNVAVDNANKRFPQCSFVHYESELLNQIQFNFIYSHHVLEHIDDKQKVAAYIQRLSAPGAVMLHILPCGNIKSLEHKLCALRKDGIQQTKGDTFFFEEEAHLQRFTTATLKALFQKNGFEVTKGFYANQYYGALKWISGMSKQFVINITRYRQAINSTACFKLLYYRSLLLGLYYIQRPYYYYSANQESKRGLLSFIKKPLFAVSSFFKSIIDKLAKQEWEHKRKKENGSEMYMVFHKTR